jgi:hypothetical protein
VHIQTAFSKMWQFASPCSEALRFYLHLSKVEEAMGNLKKPTVALSYHRPIQQYYS